MNKFFQQAATSVKTLQKKASGLYGLMGAFVMDVAYHDGIPEKGSDIKPLFKDQERMAAEQMQVYFGKDAPSTYRVVKALLVKCVAEGISIVDANGKLRGKTELEEEVEALKSPKTELEKFRSTMKTADAISAKLPAHDRIMAAALVNELLKELSNGIALAA